MAKNKVEKRAHASRARAAQHPTPLVDSGRLATPATIAGRSRMDGWTNLMTGLGVKGKDKRMHTSVNASPLLGEPELREMYRSDGFVKRLVDLPAKEMTRRGFDIQGDEQGKVAAILEERSIHRKVRDMIRWARLFGGSLAVMGLEDGGRFHVPVRPNGIKRLAFLHVYDRYRVSWTSADLYQDPMHEKFGEPQFYQVSPLGGNPFKVHESRTIRLDGMPLPDVARVQNQGWGDSIVQGCFDQIRALNGVYHSAESIVDDFVTGKLGVKNLADMLAAGEEDKIVARINNLDLSKHTINTLLLDAEQEEYHKESSSIAGLPDLIDRFAAALSSVSGMPQTKLMGRSPAGLSATGESDTRDWYDQISADQEDLLGPVYETIVRYAFLSKEGGGREPSDWKIEWRPLWEPTEKEIAEVRKMNMETDTGYFEIGVLDADEIRTSRFSGERYGHQIKLLATKAPGLPEPEEEEETPAAGGTTGKKPTVPGPKPKKAGEQ